MWWQNQAAVADMRIGYIIACEFLSLLFCYCTRDRQNLVAVKIHASHSVDRRRKKKESGQNHFHAAKCVLSLRVLINRMREKKVYNDRLGRANVIHFEMIKSHESGRRLFFFSPRFSYWPLGIHAFRPICARDAYVQNICTYNWHSHCAVYSYRFLASVFVR